MFQDEQKNSGVNVKIRQSGFYWRCRQGIGMKNDVNIATVWYEKSAAKQIPIKYANRIVLTK